MDRPSFHVITLLDALYLSVKYLNASRGRSAILAIGVAITLFLPIFTWKAAALLEQRLLQRAEASPLLLGHAGNEVALTLSSLYFRSGVESSVPFGLKSRAESWGLAVSLYVKHTVGGHPLLGTEPEYFTARSLTPAAGRLPVWIGEAVVGAELAQRLQIEVGDQVRSDASNLYNLSGAYPLLLDVVGILKPTGTPDDEIWLTDIKTTWAMDGLFHGHDEVPSNASVLADETKDQREQTTQLAGVDEDLQDINDLSKSESPVDPQDPGDPEDNVEASAALFLFSEITERNRHTFHLHGSKDDAPVTSILLFPNSRLDHDQALAHMAVDELFQAVRPHEVIRSLLDLVLRLRDALQTYFALVAVSTLSFCALVITLSLRLRRSELQLAARLGCDRWTLGRLLAAEITLLTSGALLLCAGAVHLGLHLLARAW